MKREMDFEIDADERVPNDLKKEIINVVKSSKSDWHLVNVKNFLGKKLLGLDGVVI